MAALTLLLRGLSHLRSGRLPAARRWLIRSLVAFAAIGGVGWSPAQAAGVVYIQAIAVPSHDFACSYLLGSAGYTGECGQGLAPGATEFLSYFYPPHTEFGWIKLQVGTDITYRYYEVNPTCGAGKVWITGEMDCVSIDGCVAGTQVPVVSGIGPFPKDSYSGGYFLACVNRCETKFVDGQSFGSGIQEQWFARNGELTGSRCKPLEPTGIAGAEAQEKQLACLEQGMIPVDGGTVCLKPLLSGGQLLNDYGQTETTTKDGAGNSVTTTTVTTVTTNGHTVTTTTGTNTGGVDGGSTVVNTGTGDYCSTHPTALICQTYTGSGSGTGTGDAAPCGGVGEPVCKVDPVVPDTPFVGDVAPADGVVDSLVKSANDGFEALFDPVTAPWAGFSDIEFIVDIPAPVAMCVDPQMSLAGHKISFSGWCEKAEQVRSLGEYVLWLLTAFTVFYIVTARPA